MSSSRLSAFDVLMPKKRKISETLDSDLAKPIVPPVSDPAKSTSEHSKSIASIAELKSKIGLLKKKPNDFDPVNVANWEKGERVPFMFLSLAFDLISTETGRIVITDILCNMLRTVIATTPQDLVATVYLAANEIAPAHEGVKLGIGKGVSIIKAISQAFGTTEEHVKQHNKDKKLGDLGLVAKDLGLVAKESRSSKSLISKPKPLTVHKVFNTFRQIAKITGKGSMKKKENQMTALLVASTDCESLYLTRLLQGNLRLGFSDQSLLAALGQAFVYDEKHSKPPPNIKSPLEKAAEIVKKVFTMVPNYDIIVDALLSDGVWNLPKTFSFKLGNPIGYMLAKRTNSISEISDKFKDTVFTCEYKYDGERAQIHYMEDGTLEIFSKKGERNTAKYPDVADALPRLKKPSVKSFVLDCEVVAFDKKNNKILSFQSLSTRGRKNVNVDDIKIGVCIFAFDMLYLNGQLLIQENLNIRREKLYDSFEEKPGYFQFATALTSSDIDEIQEFFEASVDNSCEGLIIKTLNSDATYEPAKRSNNWLKLKKDYIDNNIGDSLDLVPIGAFHGQGKHAGLYGSFLLACYDGDNEQYQTICKLGSGFSEAELKKQCSILGSNVIATPQKNYQVDDSSKPDVWFEPTEVWEVKAAALTISPEYRAAFHILENHKGISLRFPRLLCVREDKKPQQATSSEEIVEMFRAQKQKKQNHPSNQVESDDD